MKMKQEQGDAVKGLFKNPIAIWLSVFMGLQSLLFYCFVAWLPTILAVKGFDAEAAGVSVQHLPGFGHTGFLYHPTSGRPQE